MFSIVEEHWLQADREGTELEVISGACPRGADSFAAEAARIYKGTVLIEFPIDRSTPVKHKGEFVERAYSRNRQIAERADRLYAFVAPDRTGGTENTIKHAVELGKPVYVVDVSGNVYLEHEGRTDKVGDQ